MGAGARSRTVRGSATSRRVDSRSAGYSRGCVGCARRAAIGCRPRDLPRDGAEAQGFRHAVQCKTGRAPVGPAVVRELYGAMTHEGFPAGFVFAVSASRRPLVTLGARLGSNSWIRIASLKRPIRREEAAQLRGAPSNSRWSRRRDGHPARRGSARALDRRIQIEESVVPHITYAVATTASRVELSAASSEPSISSEE